jgi:hypothetical protein
VELLFTIFDDDALTQTGELIELLGHRLVLDDVDEPHRTIDVGKNRVGIRIPGEDHLVALDVRSILDHEDRAERDLQARRDVGVLVGRRLDEDLTFVRRDYALSVGVDDDHEPIAVRDRARDLRLARRLLGDTCRRSTDVEGSESELRSRLADRLRRDDTHRFTQVDDVHRRQVAAVAHTAETALRLAREDGTNLHRFDSRFFDLLRLLFVDQLTGFDHQCPATRLI